MAITHDYEITGASPEPEASGGPDLIVAGTATSPGFGGGVSREGTSVADRMYVSDHSWPIYDPGTNDFTIRFLLKVDAVLTQRRGLSTYWEDIGGNNRGWGLFIEKDGAASHENELYLTVSENGSSVYAASYGSNIVGAGWKCVTVVRSGTSLKAYLDGGVNMSLTGPSTIFSASTFAYVLGSGAFPWGRDGAVDCHIDKIRCWDNALSASEVTSDYLSVAGAGPMPPFSWSFTTADATAPSVANNSPTGIDIAVNSNVYFEITDTATGVDLTTLTVTVEGNTAYDWNGVGVPNDGFQAGYITGSSIVGPVGGMYAVTVDPDSDFSGSTLIAVTVDAADLESPPNVMSTFNWSFTTEDTDAPIILNQDPFPGDIGVLPTDPIKFRLQDVGGSGVDVTSIDCTVDGGNAIIGGVVQAGFTGTVIDIGGNVYDISFTKDATLGEGLISIVVDCDDLASPPNSLNAPYSFTTVGTGPTITNEQPPPSGTGAPETNIYFELDDDISGVVEATIDCTIDGIDAIINGVIQAGYGGSIVPDGTTRGFDVDIDPPGTFSPGDTIPVTVYCEDASGAPLNASYSFTIGFPNTPFVIDTQCRASIIGSPIYVPLGATGVVYHLTSLDADVVSIQLGPSASGIVAIYDFVNNLDGTGEFKVDFSATQINRILSIITIDNVGNISAESPLFNITIPIDEVPGTEFKIRPHEYPHSDTCNRLLDDVPESKMILQAGIVVPYSFNKTSFDVNVIEIGRTITITVSYEGAPGKLEQTEIVVIPTATEFQVDIQLAEGRNFVRATDGEYQDYVVVTATHYATYLCSVSEEIYNETQIRLDEQNQAIESPLSTRLSEHLLEYTDLLPNVKSQKVFSSKLGIRSMVPEVSEDRSVRDLTTALTLNTPIVERTKNQATLFEPGIYPMFNHIEHGYGFDFHVWTHNQCSSKWRAFIRYLNNFSAFTLLSATESEIVFINDRGETVRHSFDPSAGECSLLDSVIPLLCLGEIPVFLETDVLTTIKLCYVSYPFDSYISAAHPLGERAFFDSGLPFDSGGSLDYDYLDPGDDGWVGLPVAPRFDYGYSLDSWGPGMPATGSITALAQASLSDGDQFTMNDGDHPAVTFYFDKTGTYLPTGGYDDTNVRVLIFNDTTAEEVADTMRGAINGAAKLYITPDSTGAATIYLTHTNNSENGNQLITEVLAAGTLAPTGMSGGGSCVWTEGIVTAPAFLSSADVTVTNLITVDAEFDAYQPIYP
jgi:hypothetical protein